MPLSKRILHWKLAGLDEKNVAMKLAKKFIHKEGGAENVNVFTRISLALFGQVSWKSSPLCLLRLLIFQCGFLSIFIKSHIGQGLF